LAGAASSAKSPALTLVPVSVGAAAKGNAIQLHSPGGWRLDLPVEVAIEWLAELLRKLP
jgi:hypothetical protein